MQFVEAEQRQQLPLLDVEQLLQEERALWSERLWQQFCQQPLMVQQRGQLRTLVVQLDEGEYELYVSLPALSADEPTLRLLVQEWSLSYRGMTIRTP